MRHAIVGSIVLITATAGLAQNRPALTWEGQVNGTAVLMIQGDRVDVDNRSSASVSQTDYRFRVPLPDSAARIEVENRLGGAQVRILEQPRRNNNFTAMVEIATRGRAAQRVSLDFYWDEDLRRNSGLNRDNRDDRDIGNRGRGARRGGNNRASQDAAGSANWSGEVDDEVFILLRGRQLLNTAVRGRAVYGQQMEVNAPLPRRPVTVTLQNIEGRGQIELAEQPDQQNNFTAKVRILDKENGAGHYSFTLAWDDIGYGNSGAGAVSGGVLSPSGGGIANNNGDYQTGANSARWAGQVDGRVRVTFRGNQASSQRLTGAEVYGEQASFGSSLPRRGSLDVSVNKLRGRGDVDIVQRPEAGNGYTLIVEINDKDGGADAYDLEVSWR